MKSRFKIQRIMRKLILAVALMASITAFAQTSETITPLDRAQRSKAFWNRVVMDVDLGSGFKQHDMTPLSIGGQIGYRIIPRLYPFLAGGYNYGLFDKDGVKSYTNTRNLGGGLGFTFAKSDNVDFDLRASVMTSIGNADWKQTVYDARLLFRVNSGSILNLNIGVGFRHINSRTAGIRDYNGVYGTIGFGI